MYLLMKDILQSKKVLIKKIITELKMMQSENRRPNSSQNKCFRSLQPSLLGSGLDSAYNHVGLLPLSHISHIDAIGSI